jgi:hypothetical protein
MEKSINEENQVNRYSGMMAFNHYATQSVKIEK